MKELEYCVKGFRTDTLTRDETLFHCANGYLGVRGCLEEGGPGETPTIRGTYINGFSEDEDICYGERLYGFPQTKQVMANLPDAQGVRLWTDDGMAACYGAGASDISRRLDLAGGFTERSFSWRSGGGTLRIRVCRMASFVRRELFLLRYEVTSEDYSGMVRLDSTLDGDVRNFCDPKDPRVASETAQKIAVTRHVLSGEGLGLQAATLRSRRRVACVALHELQGEAPRLLREGDELTARYTRKLLPGETLTLTKYCVYTDEPASSDLLADALTLARDAKEKGFSFWQAGQRAFLDAFWTRSRVKIEDGGRTQAYLDFCLYGMLCAAGQNGRSSVAAKGLSGEGYEGHYFWDCETYVLPFFLLSAPREAKMLLDFRYSHLDGAREHARIMGHARGALYPWRTITGSECSSYYPSGSAQYHINADIAHAFCQYWYLTGDENYLPEICEVLVETARLFLDTGHMLDGSFRIDGVTGPDEYTCIVDNNYYTNAGAAYVFRETVKLCRELEKRGGLKTLADKIGLMREELSAFSEAGARMYLPMDETLGICKQDDRFLQKKRLDLSKIPPENFPLLLHYHPLFINRCQVCKQADTVLAHYMFREEVPAVMMRSYRYYETVTTHDSSLSACVFSLMAARLGDMDRAVRYFDMTAGIDMQDQNGNTRDGLHIANMGGAFLDIAAGFGGLRILPDGVRLFPLVPAGWKGYAFPLAVRGGRVLVSVDQEGCSLRLLEGEPPELRVYDRVVRAGAGQIRIARRARGVVFDLDGVVTDTAKYHYAAWKRIAGELGIAFDREKNERFKGVSRARCMELLLEIGGLKMPPQEQKDWTDRKNAYYLEALSALSPRDILPGITECISELREEEIPAALFSVSKNTDFILKKLGLQDAFDAVVTGCDVEHSKPHFEGYLLAAERLGADPRLLLMVEDAVAGLEGAKNLSMFTLGVGTSLPDNCADMIVANTVGIMQALRRFIE